MIARATSRPHSRKNTLAMQQRPRLRHPIQRTPSPQTAELIRIQNAPDRVFAEITQSQAGLVVYPMLGPSRGIDVTRRVVEVIAQELWRLHGGNDIVNWLEAERLLREAIKGVRPRSAK